MKIAILSQSSHLYSTKRLIEAGIARGHDVQVVEYLKCHLNINYHQPSILYEGKTIEKFDVVIPRISPPKTFSGLAIVRQFETMGTLCINHSEAIARSRDKLRCLQILASKNIPIPTTGFACGNEDIEGLISIVDGSPVVIKLLQGSQGIGVVLAQTDETATSMIQAFQSLYSRFLVQEFIEEAKGVDIRCFVIDDRVVASMKRQAVGDEFRSNLHRGGLGEKVPLTSQEEEIAIRSAQAMELKIAGVDLLRSNHGSVVIEVNSSPGLQGIENVTGIDVAEKIIEFLEQSYFSEQ